MALPVEIIALIHHVELSEAGWWERAVRRLVLAMLWVAGTSLSQNEINDRLASEFGISIMPDELEKLTASLLEEGIVVTRVEGLALTIEGRKVLEREIHAAEELESSARDQFLATLHEICPEASHDRCWELFSKELLNPLVSELGAETYDLLFGDGFDLEPSPHLARFLSNFSDDEKPCLQETIDAFLDPRVAIVRDYVLRALSASFLVRAASLDEKTLSSVAAYAGKTPTFEIFVDSNFLFPALRLEDTPAVDAAQSLLRLRDELSGHVDIRLRVTPETLTEARTALGNARDFLRGVTFSRNVLEGTGDQRYSGVVQKFMTQARSIGGIRSPDEYFRPVIDNLLTLVRNLGIELHNEDLSPLKTRQDVVDDIVSHFEFEKSRRGSGAKKYEQVEHDMVMWHFVRDRRGAFVESPLGAENWIVTIDFRFLGFDAHKQRRTSSIAVCLHPTALIQLLQFWVPRSARLDEALLSSLRLPFLLQDFDVEAERITVQILRAVSKFEKSEQLSATAIHGIVVNDALRKRIARETAEQKQIKLVREALIEQDRELRGRLENAEGQLEAIKQSLNKTAEEVGVREAELEESQLSEKKLARALSIRDFYSFTLAPLSIVALLITATIAWWIQRSTDLGVWRAVAIGAGVSALLWYEVAHSLSRRHPAVRDQPFWTKGTRLRRTFWGAIWTILLGVVGTAIWETWLGT